MSIIQVTFDPTKWTAGFGAAPTPGANGYNAFTVIPDKDGTTFWAFEYFGAGFARVNYSDGSIVHQDAMMGTPGFTNYWYNKEDGSSYLQQDNAGHYFAIPNNGSSNQFLNKFSIGAGSAGNLLNGYCTNPVTLDLFAALSPAFNHFNGFEAMRVFTSGGVNYCVLMTEASGGSMYVINTDTMAFVGSYTVAGTGRGWATFMDSSGDIWGVFTTTNASTQNISLVKWHPADGATGSTLNFTTPGTGLHTVATGVAVSSFAFATYVTSNNSLFLGGSISWTGPQVNINLTTFAINTSKADDLTFFYNGTLDSPQSVMDVGFQGCAVMVAGDVTPHTTNSHLGGILNYIDPVALTVTASLDATGAVLGAGFLAGGTFHDGHSGNTVYCPMSNIAYSYANNAAAMAFEFVGSAVYIVPFANACTPPAPPTVVFTAVPDTIHVGQTSTLTWFTGNATTVVIDSGVGTVAVNGSAVVTPAQTNTYKLTATGAGGTVTALATVYVLSDDAQFSLQKLIVTMKQDTIPVRGRN